MLLPRRLLIFINPVAGAQDGKSLFEKYVKKMFDLAEIVCVVEITGDSHFYCLLVVCTWSRRLANKSAPFEDAIASRCSFQFERGEIT